LRPATNLTNERRHRNKGRSQDDYGDTQASELLTWWHTAALPGARIDLSSTRAPTTHAQARGSVRVRRARAARADECADPLLLYLTHQF